MAHEKQDGPSPVDDEFAGRHGTTASEASIEEERHPEHHPEDPGDAVAKVAEEAEQTPGVLGTAGQVLHELDREFSGEYERREDPDAIGPHGEPPAKRGRGGGVPAGRERRPAPDADERVARPAVEAEEERFEGLVNEPANPKREPGL
jgi:hypothetical protein